LKRKLFVTLLTSAALTGAHAQAGGTQKEMPRQDAQQQEEHVIASPNPTVDDSKTATIEPGKISSARVQPASATTAAPMKKKPRRRRPSRSRQ
jgi:hypothetical protein